MSTEERETVYLLLGGADGALDVTLRTDDAKITALTIESKSGFGGMIWRIVAGMLEGGPLEEAVLNERLQRMYRSGLLPEELNLQPLLQALIRLGRS